MNSRCASCRWHGCGEIGCDYTLQNQKSRLIQVYRMLGVKTLTPEAFELLKPKNCPFYERGRRINRYSVDFLLPGSTAKQRKTTYRVKDGRCRSWDTQKARRLYLRGATDGEIAKAVGVTRQAVCMWRVSEGMPCNRVHEKLPGEMIRRLNTEGLTDRQIAERLSLKTIQVSRYRRHHEIGGVTSGPKESRDYSEAWELYDRGCNDMQISRTLGIPASTVWYWRQKHGLPAWPKGGAARPEKRGGADTEEGRT